ncbi:Putative short-chain type dehydrogenase/reductase [Mycobacterium talmoniae]|uniref:Short-chain type dehydrogenase/reductase n=1 Tax=Mycobacterium talmoniae TaxID=1858794 RepID=A0A2S8BKS1_9MYCO|nr:Putative short-chain type dehydrogenase/reductase [Mycobacterium talmoniae]
MAGRVEGKVAFITGAARGQGRSHAVRLAQEGADIIAIDVCQPISSNTEIPPSTPDDLAETADLVKAENRRIVTAEADVRDYAAVKAAVDGGVEQLGRLDIIVANAGIGNGGNTLDKTSERDWQDMIDVNLSGVWKTVKAGVPHLLSGGRGGSIVLTSSVGGLKAYPHTGHYIAAKHGVVGLMRSFAVELGQHHIRVNSVHPTNVNTPMFMNEDDEAVSARPGQPGARRYGGGRAADARAARRLGRRGRHQQCGAVPGIRRGSLYHRCPAARRRREHVEVTATPAASTGRRTGRCSAP